MGVSTSTIALRNGGGINAHNPGGTIGNSVSCASNEKWWVGSQISCCLLPECSDWVYGSRNDSQSTVGSLISSGDGLGWEHNKVVSKTSDDTNDVG